MRPPEFTGGNKANCAIACIFPICFNEAAGIHRRKRILDDLPDARPRAASMRPPEFTGGNS